MKRGAGRRVGVALGALVAAPIGAAAQDQNATPTFTLGTVSVVGVSPMPGSGVDRDKVPANVVTLSSDDIAAGASGLAGALERLVPSVSINDVAVSPFQPDVEFRGFAASPILGTPQGLAVYQNGVRINEAFGDAVNWDLVPDFAIDRATVTSGNPVYGLNALGGALALDMKTGFNFSGVAAQLSGGSFQRTDGTLEWGARAGNVASYVGARGLYQEGWRQHSPASIHQLYADIGAEKDGSTLHLSFTGADNTISAIGPTPAELLQQSATAIYTWPQATQNNLALVTLAGSLVASDTVSVAGNVYYRRLHQRIVNGNTTDAQPCGAPPGPGTLCFNDPTTVLFATNGAPIPNLFGTASLGEIDRTGTDTDGLGGSLQLTATQPVFDRDNHFILGASIDRADTMFRASSELGVIAPDLLVAGSGFIIDQPAGDLAPVALATTSGHYGLYVTDTLDVTSRLALTASGRYNLATIELVDRSGTGLDGSHRFTRLNPAFGATYKVTPLVTAYAGYSEANRAPTPSELACADPTRPCIIDSFVVSDPNLRQVVAHSWEAGLRGEAASGAAGGIAWTLGIFRTDSSDDILNVPSAISGFGYFQNAGNTRRQGVEAGVNYRTGGFRAHADYAYLDATFRTPLTLSSPFNPAADADGNIAVRPGDHLPSLPTHRLNLGAEYGADQGWTIGADLVVASGQYLRGDEANQTPKIPGHHVVNLHASYALREHFELFALVQNLFDARYDNFGTFFDTTQIAALNLSDPRSLSPGAPLAVFLGVRARF